MIVSINDFARANFEYAVHDHDEGHHHVCDGDCGPECEHAHATGEKSPVEAARGEARAAADGGDVADHHHELHSGNEWHRAELSFSFPTEADAYFTGRRMSETYGTGEAEDGFRGTNAAQETAVRYALDQFAAVSNVTFSELTGADAADADIRYAQSDQPPTAWAYYPSTFAEGGDVWFGREGGYYRKPLKGEYAWHTILHETGHALGLRHGHDHGALADEVDSMEYSVMTYRAFLGDPLNGGYSNGFGGYAQSLMQQDIAAAQDLFGANYDYRDGNDVYRWSPKTGEMFVNGEGQGRPIANKIFETVWDGGGNDWFDFSNYRKGVDVDLAPGAATIASTKQLAHLNAFEPGGAGEAIFASGNVYTALLHDGDARALIENARGGTGDDVLAGNEARNRLLGGEGDDQLDGREGRDHLIGGAGSDVVIGGAGGDILKGEKGDDVLEGGAGRDRLKGGAGDDVLEGGAGRDKLVGGAGADAFVFGPNGGRDIVTDFEAGVDVIDLSAYEGAFAKMKGEKIFIDGDVIRLKNVDVNTLDADDFIF